MENCFILKSWTIPFDVNDVIVRRGGKFCGAVFTSWVEWTREESEQESFVRRFPRKISSKVVYKSWKIVKKVKFYGRSEAVQRFVKLSRTKQTSYLFMAPRLTAIVCWNWSEIKLKVSSRKFQWLGVERTRPRFKGTNFTDVSSLISVVCPSVVGHPVSLNYLLLLSSFSCSFCTFTSFFN